MTEHLSVKINHLKCILSFTQSTSIGKQSAELNFKTFPLTPLFS